MTLSFAPVRSHRLRKRLMPPPPDSGPRFKLVAFILAAFLGGYIVGKRESTPTTVSSWWKKLTTVRGTGPTHTLDHWLGQLTKARLLVEDKMRQDEYGDYLGRLIMDPKQMNNIFVVSDLTKQRLQRRLLTKVLQANGRNERPRFVWTTAGDASAAGHGNMYNQSYTQVLQDTVGMAFAELNIDFVGRNYGMSWYTSAPELALCMEEIYGLDVDLLVWDFSMQDGTQYYKFELFLERALQHPNLPILLVIENRDSPRWMWIQERMLDQFGLGVILYDKQAIDLARTRIPKDNGPFQLPPALQDWVCDGEAVEGSTPCDDPIRFFVCERRDTAEQCLNAKYKTVAGCDSSQKPFHPGWKEHLFRGRLMGQFMLDMLEDSLLLLEQWGATTPFLMDRLVQMHQGDKLNATLLPAPREYDGIETNSLREWTPTALFRGLSICHTALLPAETRFRGIVTETPHKIGTWEGGYEQGTNKILAHSKDGDLEIAYEATDRLRCASPKIDHKDFFIVRSADYWVSTVVPNNAELKTFNERKQPLQGIIAVCLQLCPMERCSDDYIGFGKSMNSQRGQIGIRIDDVDVTNVRTFDHNCHLLEHDKGLRWGSGKAGHGRYKMSFRLHTKMKGLDFTIRISSIIVT